MRPILLAATAVVTAFAFACGSGLKSPVPRDATPGPSGPSEFLQLDWESRTLRALDGATLEALPGREPIPIGQWAWPLVSPDGRTMAVVVGETQGPVGEVRIFDLESWKEALQVEELKGALTPLAWSRDSRYLYVGRHRELWVVDVEAGEAHLLADLGTEFDDVKVSLDGARLYVFAYAYDSQSAMTMGASELLEVASGTGDVIRRLQLPDVTIGQREQRGSDGDLQYASHFPARVMSPDGERYYIAHADSEVVTVINLDEMRIESSAEPKRPASVWGRIGGFLGGLLVSEAEAKGGPYRGKQALVSPDGRILYVTGVYDGDPSNQPSGRDPLGLTAIDTTTMTVRFEEEGVDSITLSPDGETLYATGWSYEWTPPTGNEYWPDNYEGIGMKALSARSGEVLAQLTPDAVYDRMVLAPDGHHLLLLTNALYEMPLEERRLAARVPGDQLAVIVDGASLEVIDEVRLSSSFEFVAAR